ncbi:MAG TPA: hypothetical protein H9863_10165 [Candidatus Odoribacter faecigallinarum]|jgi:hypothetical protein|uniref:Uncharacterized protein n=1 Tax=Candidatus Odoribacter faecigallinarum TaxID=2838706 RepID=A0A9D1V1L9_9BACT|nr:hypothetical protein [Candidatus Odoribacter faecigallinarum]
MFLTVFLIVVVLLAIALAGLAITILVKKGGKFPEIHIGRNKAMKKLGIHCANTTDRLERENYKPIER